MNKLIVDATSLTPYVVFNKYENIFKIVGKSLPEDVKNFYIPLIHWFEQYSNDPNPFTNLYIDLEYFNTSSSKMILVLLNKLRDIQKKGNQVLVTWVYPPNDAEIEESGEEFAELLNIPFQFISKE